MSEPLWRAYWRVYRRLHHPAGLGLLILCLLAVAGTSAVAALLVQVEGDLFSALAALDGERVKRCLLGLAAAYAVHVVLEGLAEYVPARLQVLWRERLTHHGLAIYLAERGYYRLEVEAPQIDNPDQRLAQDIDNLTTMSLEILKVLVHSVTSISTRVALIWLLSPGLLVVLLSYSLAGNLFALLSFARHISRLDNERFQREADFRYALIRLEDHAESIAFYRGETSEGAVLDGRIEKLIATLFRRLVWLDGLFALFRVAYERAPQLMALIILVPRVAAGDLEVGQLFQAVRHAQALEKGLDGLLQGLSKLTALNASVLRVAHLDQSLSAPRPKGGLKRSDSDHLEVRNLTLETPDGDRVLFRDLNLRVDVGESLLISGPSGSGKSSLLRALADLWSRGEGEVLEPPRSATCFLPQNPYLFQGTLREQLAYPAEPTSVSDEELHLALQRARLGELADRFGLDEEVDLPGVLSGGEKQRLALARLFLSRPRVAFLDEATSALDSSTQEQIYEELSQLDMTLVSVAHRPGLQRFHTQTLKLGAEP